MTGRCLKETLGILTKEKEKERFVDFLDPPQLEGVILECSFMGLCFARTIPGRKGPLAHVHCLKENKKVVLLLVGNK